MISMNLIRSMIAQGSINFEQVMGSFNVFDDHADELTKNDANKNSEVSCESNKNNNIAGFDF